MSRFGIAVSTLFLAVALLLSGSAEAALTQQQRNEILAAHNQARCEVQPTAASMPAMTWDPLLEQVAQEYANGCVWAHNPNRSTRYQQLGGSGYVGENLAMGTVGYFTVTDFVDMWVDEKQYYNYAANTCATGQVCGHYTQVVWASSTKVGCGLAICGANSYLVCNYSPGGNYPTQPYTQGSGTNEACGGRSLYDFNGDVRDDILLRDSSNGIGMWLMNGASIIGGGAVGSAGSSTIAGIADFSGDGKADILLRDSAGSLGMWIMNGNVITSGHAVGSPGGYNVAGTADFTGDGKADILLRDSSGNLGLWVMNGHLITSGHFVGSPGAYTVAATADFNGDGRADILLRDSSGSLGLWIMNGHVITSGHFVGSPGAYSVAGAGDFNADRKSDILLRDSAGNIGLWMMDGHLVTSGHFVGSPGAYSVNSVRDYNGDSKSDILLRNIVTGEVGVWLMNGHLITSGAAVGSPGITYTVY